MRCKSKTSLFKVPTGIDVPALNVVYSSRQIYTALQYVVLRRDHQEATENVFLMSFPNFI